MLKAEVNTQVLEVYRRLKTLFKPKKKRNQCHFFKKQTKLTGKLRK